MDNHYFRIRLITDEQIAQILAWRQNRHTLRQFARELGVSPGTLLKAAARRGAYRAVNSRGRDRKLTDAQIAAVQEWQSKRKTRKQLAREIGITLRMFEYAITCRGLYKSVPKEQLAASQHTRRRRIERFRAVNLV